MEYGFVLSHSNRACNALTASTERKQNPDEVTKILMEMRRGDMDAFDRLFPIVYDELRRVAANLLRQERRNQTLQPTALVNEAYRGWPAPLT